jgi:hypothetical protein
MSKLDILKRDYETLRESLALAFFYKEPPVYVAWLTRELADLERQLRKA